MGEEDEGRSSVGTDQSITDVSNPPLQRDASPASRLRAPELARWASAARSESAVKLLRRRRLLPRADHPVSGSAARIDVLVSGLAAVNPLVAIFLIAFAARRQVVDSAAAFAFAVQTTEALRFELVADHLDRRFHLHLLLANAQLNIAARRLRRA